jgi:hypothetical protein
MTQVNSIYRLEDLDVPMVKFAIGFGHPTLDSYQM